MTDPSLQELTRCPKCRTSFRTEVVRVLSIEDANLKKLLKGNINCPNCPKCDTAFKIEVEHLIFKDVEKPFILVQTAAPEENEIDNIEEEVDCLATEMAYQQNLERPIVRLVFTREDFLEKIFLHQRNLDDRLIEYAKFQLFQNNGGAGLTEKKHRLLYDFASQNLEQMQFFIVDRKTANATATIALPMEDFKKMAEEFEQDENLQRELERAFPNCVVNVDRLYE